MSSGLLRSPRGNRKTVVVGFDFGTHSTKVVYRERGQADGQIGRFDEAADGYPMLTSPSLVRCTDGRLFFGTEALRASDGQLYRSLKVNLLPGYQQNATPYPDGLDSRFLVAAYFAWAFLELRKNLSEYAESNVFLNLAAPMSNLENAELKNSYLQIIQTAWKLALSENPVSICQGITLSRAREVISPLLNQPVLGTEHRRFEVLPETIAPVVSLSLDPWMKPGMYVIVDTGAGTTEISVFHAGESGADQKVLCYQDETMILGGNDLDLARGRPDRLDEITERLEKQYRRIWHLGYELDKPLHLARRRWKKLTLVLSGGGTRHDAVATRLGNVNPMHPWHDRDTRLTVGRHVPATLKLVSNMSDDERSMFAVANGLAIERMHWPIIFASGQIETLVPTEEVSKPQGYWYVDAK